MVFGPLELLILIVVLLWLFGGVVRPIGNNAVHVLLVLVVLLILFRQWPR